jgi:hypothetical protein
VRGTESPVTAGFGTVQALAIVVALSLAACSGILESPPTPAPEAFPGVAGRLGEVGIDVLSWTSGDSGCDDASLNPTAIRFTAQGLDQPTPLTLRIYIFGDHAAWDRRLADVDACAAKWTTDPGTFEFVQTSPYVVAGQGPWPPGFAAALRKGIETSAGSGG